MLLCTGQWISYYRESHVCNSFQNIPPGSEHKLKSFYTDFSACRIKLKVGGEQGHPSSNLSISQGSLGAANLVFGLPHHDEDTGSNMKIENSMHFSINENSRVFYKPFFFCLWASAGHSFTDSILVWQQHFPAGVISENTAAFKPWMNNHLVLGESKLPVWGPPCPLLEPNIEQTPPKFLFFNDLLFTKWDSSLFSSTEWLSQTHAECKGWS